VITTVSACCCKSNIDNTDNVHILISVEGDRVTLPEQEQAQDGDDLPVNPSEVCARESVYNGKCLLGEIFTYVLSLTPTLFYVKRKIGPRPFGKCKGRFTLTRIIRANCSREQFARTVRANAYSH